ncbi:hypothetical protein ET445_01825 [Agromyces protaetiae]|uniref:Transcriptional regulator n=1 Tax=Agromyces protaetiae TaxID=2509455 RepID=A0A4P6F8T6_9MICO|nr:type IV toxin-antitoxin system AbiEi family antitoxin domain-containing protein [Agromyces protaetiae]QAY72262.1 hypothetical protein ET445_01825 [Agromyces protaetiae]
MTFLPITPNGLIRFDAVAELGLRGELLSALRSGEVQRVRRGVYTQVTDVGASSHWERAAERYRIGVIAAAQTMDAPVFTSFSAIALARLPIFGGWPDEVYVLSRNGSANRRRGVIATASRGPVESRLIDGCATTSIEFSLIQLARRATLAAALTAVDAAIRVPRFGGARPMTTIEALRAQHEAMLPYPGSLRVEAVLSRATPLADTPLETVSRLAFEQLGFEAPTLQLPMWLPELGRQAFLDFYWESVDAGAEADGRGKYLSGDGSAGSAAHTVIREKDRENAIRRQLRAFDRWDWADALALGPLAARLDAMGVPRTRSPKLMIPKRDAPAARPIRGAGPERPSQR